MKLLEEVTAAGCGHLLPLLRVVRPPRAGSPDGARGVAPERLTLVTPYLRGGNLFDRIERYGPLPEGNARRVAAQLLSALAHLHQLRIVHGNLQPAALLFESVEIDQGALRLGGLGGARRVPAAAAASLEGACGSPDYTCPEALTWLVPGAHPRRYGAAADAWSAGALLYTMLCGFAPFRGETAAELHRAALGRLAFPDRLPPGAAGGGAAGSATCWPRVSPAAKELISGLLRADARDRLTVEAALHHPWVTDAFDAHAARAAAVSLRDRQHEWSSRLFDRHATDGTPHGTARTPHSQRRSSPGRPRPIAAAGVSPAPSDRSAGAGGGGNGAARAESPKGPFGMLSRWLQSQLKARPAVDVLLVGLDGAGKSTLLLRLKHGADAPPAAPTIGIGDVDTFSHEAATFTLHDVGGQKRMREEWLRRWPPVGSGGEGEEGGGGAAVLFVVDAADAERHAEAAAEIGRLRRDARVGGAPLLVFGNKADAAGALGAEKLRDALRLGGEAGCHVLAGSARTGEGVVAAFDWLAGRVVAGK